MDFQTRLRELRKGKQLNQTKLGNEIGVTLKQIQRYELGENEPTASILIALADFFDVSLDYLVGKGGEKMDLADVSEVVELSDSEDVNRYLKKNWKIINIYNKPFDLENPVYNYLIPHFVMGWVGPNPKHPDGYPK